MLVRGGNRCVAAGQRRAIDATCPGVVAESGVDEASARSIARGELRLMLPGTLFQVHDMLNCLPITSTRKRV